MQCINKKTHSGFLAVENDKAISTSLVKTEINSSHKSLMIKDSIFYSLIDVNFVRLLRITKISLFHSKGVAKHNILVAKQLCQKTNK